MGRRPRATLRRGASWPDASRKGAVCSPHVAQNALFRYIAAREAWGATPRQAAGGVAPGPAGLGLARRLTERRSLQPPCHAECAFPSRRRPGGVGRNPPPACGALWKVAQLGKCVRATPRQAAGGGFRQGPQASAWPDASRKGAVWAEGLADGTPWARPGHHQAVSCGLRRCRELRVRRNPLVSSTFLSLETDRRRAVGPFLSRLTIGERPPSASCLAPFSP